MNTTELKAYLNHLIEQIERGKKHLLEIEVHSPVVFGHEKEDGTPETSQPETSIFIRFKNIA